MIHANLGRWPRFLPPPLTVEPMRRARTGRCALLILGMACAVGALCAPGVQAQEKATSALPLKKVVLFNSGVGFFEHRAKVQGDAQVDLKFNVDDINDLLKSMVLQDEDGGRISTVTYGSMDPITKTLRTFAIDLTSNPTLADLLGQIRGEQVEIETANKVVGTILGVEKRRQQVGKEEVVEVEYLNLLTDEGLRSMPLATVGKIKLANPKLDAELRQALTVLALGHATDKKTVSLSFMGEGDRNVRVGYIQEAPIWKTSYRLVLSDDERPFLQGWAIVENTTEEDWQDVNLSLVSGRPISFVMNLYQPLYIPRPLVEPELFASLRPQTYGQDLAKADADFGRAAEASRKSLEAADAAGAPMAPGPPGGIGGGGMGGFQAKGYRMNLQEGVQTVAQAGDVGELFQYDIETPVTLPRQQSAMLPIVNGSVEGRKVSIYNPNVHAKHPLNGLQMKNNTGLHLMQGPITVFDGGTYAGDAQIADLQPDTERLISYAMDLDTEVAPEIQGSPEQLLSVRIIKGTLWSSRKYKRAQVYTIKNSSRKDKEVLIEYPFDASWKLTAPKEPTEKTRDLYRFSVKAEPGVPAKLAVEEEQVVDQQVALGNLDDGTIQFYISAKVVSDAVKKALAEVIQRKAAIGALATEQQQLENNIAVIGQEQNRIRENMAQLEKNSELYNRYVKKFGQQEDQIETARGDIAKLVEQIEAKRKELDEFLLGLEID